MCPAQQDPGHSVTHKALSVLQTFDSRRPELTLSDISRRAGLPLSTTHRLVHELTSWGALERNENGGYHIGLRLWEVASLAPRSVALREVAMPFLEDLYEVSLENVQLAVMDGGEVVFVERISGQSAVHVASRMGGRLPLHATGVGLVLLAHAPDDVQANILASDLTVFTANTITSPDLLRRTLAEVRRTGVAVCDGHIRLHTVSIAVPVRDSGDRVVAALSVVVPSAPGVIPALLPIVASAGRGISRALGAPSAALRRRPGT